MTPHNIAIVSPEVLHLCPPVCQARFYSRSCFCDLFLTCPLDWNSSTNCWLTSCCKAGLCSICPCVAIAPSMCAQYASSSGLRQFHACSRSCCCLARLGLSAQISSSLTTLCKFWKRLDICRFSKIFKNKALKTPAFLN